MGHSPGGRPMTARARFTKNDIKRAASGMTEAGITAFKIVIDPNGKIDIVSDPKNRPEDTSEWADLD